MTRQFQWLVLGAVCVWSVQHATISHGQNRRPAADASALSTNLAAVPNNALGFIHIRVADLLNSPAGKVAWPKMAKEAEDPMKMFGATMAETDLLTIVVSAPGEPPMLIVSTLKPYAPKAMLDAALGQHKEQNHKAKPLHVSSSSQPFAIHFLDNRTYVWGTSDRVRAWLERPSGAGSPFQDALNKAGGKHHVAGAFNVPPEMVQHIKQEIDRNAGDAGSQAAAIKALKPLLEARQIAGTLSVGNTKAELRLQLTFASDAAAKEALSPARDGIVFGRTMLKQHIATMTQELQLPNMSELFTGYEAALRSATVDQRGMQLDGIVQLPFDPKTFSAFAEATGRVRLTANRTKSANNLKRILLAMHTQHDALGEIPPSAIHSKDGKPLLSWRVAILPYVEEEALYKQFKLDEPWDSEHNKMLLPKMPKLFAPVRSETKDLSTTHYQLITGKETAFQGPKGVRFADIRDGMSNTVLVVEAGEAVPWTKPQDLVFSPDKPLPKLGGHFPDGFNVGLADGSVLFLKKGVTERTVRALMTKDGREVISIDDLDGLPNKPRATTPARDVQAPRANARPPAPAKTQPPVTPAPASTNDLSRVVIPDFREAAVDVLTKWLQARGIDHEVRKDTIVLRRGGVLMNIYPIVHKGELDRLRVSVFYFPKDEYKKSKDIDDLAVKLNRSQNFMQIFVDNDGDIGAASNLTFVDELTAREFDFFLDAMAQLVKIYVLTEETLKLVK